MNTGKKTPRARTIALMNQKGGVGKTTTTINLGAALADLGATVLLIDMDPQAHLTLSVGMDPNVLDATVYDLLIDPDVEAAPIIEEAQEKLWVLPAEVNLAGAEAELVTMEDKTQRLKKKLKPVIHLFDYVLIDCPPSLGLLTMNALALAGEVIVPMQSHFLALQGFSKLLETVQMVRQAINPTLKVSGVILCMHEQQTNLAKEVMGDLEGFFESARRFPVPWSDAVLFDPPIRRNVKLAESPSFGQTIFDYSPWCPGARDYRKLAENIAEYHGFLTAEEEASEVVDDQSGVQNITEPIVAPTPEKESESKPMIKPLQVSNEAGVSAELQAEMGITPAAMEALEQGTDSTLETPDTVETVDENSEPEIVINPNLNEPTPSVSLPVESAGSGGALPEARDQDMHAPAPRRWASFNQSTDDPSML